MNRRHGHRGYIGSRRYFGDRAPQHVQNLVVRDFCARNGHTYLLSATEYAMAGCFMVLEDLVEEAPTLEGIVLYSIFMLPQDRERRTHYLERFLSVGVTLHGAVENFDLTDKTGLWDLETLWRLRQLSDNADALS